MKIYYSSRFAHEYKKLPRRVKEEAKKKEIIFRNDVFDPRLDTHKLKGGLKDFYSFSISKRHRIIFEFADKKIVWFHSVGDHDIYKLWD